MIFNVCYKVTAYVLRAPQRFKTRETESGSSTVLTPQEITNAGLFWILHAQKEIAQQKDYKTLKTQLSLFLMIRDCESVVVNFIMQTFHAQLSTLFSSLVLTILQLF